MRISYNRVFVAECDFSEKDALKAAGGWRWHPAAGKCDGPGKCWGCKSGAPFGRWWTANAGAAARLAQYADASAKPLIEAHQQALMASRAADAGVELPCPEGLAYLGYQRAGIAYAINKLRVLIADEQGLGKTIQALGLFNADGSLERVLILCPASVKINWQREATKWLVHPYAIARINAFGDLAQIPATGRAIVITNPDRLVGKAGAPIAAALSSMHWDAIVADEVQGYCNPEAQRSQILYGRPAKRAKAGQPASPAIPGLIDKTRRFIALTGTPIPNRPIEMFGLLHALAPDTFSSSFTFGKRYCGGHQETVPQRGGGRRAVWKFDGATHLDELQDKLRSTCMVRRLKKDVLKELPPKRRSLVVLENEQADPAWQDDSFDDFLDGRDERSRPRARIARLEADVEMAEAAGDEDAYAAAIQALGEAVSVAFTAMSEERHRIGLQKLPQVVDHIRTVLDGGREKLIVFAHHHDAINRLVAELADYGVVSLTGADAQADRQKAVDTFQQDSRVRVFVGQIDAAGVGLTLTASSHVIFAEWSWAPARLAQAEDRCVAAGQPVLTPDGWRPIEDICAGDMVLGRDGLPHRVLDAWSRGSTKLMVEISLEGWPEPVVTTVDHQFLLADGCWREAGELRPGDRLAMPHIEAQPSNLTTLPFEDDCRLPRQFMGAGGLQNNGRLYVAPAMVSVGDDALFAFGYFAGDGFTSTKRGKGRCVGFAGNKGRKRAAVERCVAWMRSVGVSASIDGAKGNDSLEARCYSGEWAFWFAKHFGHGAHAKRLHPALLTLNREQSRAVLAGLLSSDGYARGGRREYSTMSKVLAAHVACVMLNAGHRVCVTHGSTGQTIVSYSDTGLSQDSLVRSVLIRYPRKLKTRESVYDLTVEDSASFVVGLATVHNCHRIGQANAVLVEYLILDGTLEARMAQVVLGKQMVSFAALDAHTAVAPITVPQAAEQVAPKPKLPVKVWPVATPEERRAAAIAMQLLAGACDGARKRDGAGFSAMDVHCGHGLAERSQLRPLTDGEVALAKKLARKYKKQLADTGVLDTLGVV